MPQNDSRANLSKYLLNHSYFISYFLYALDTNPTMHIFLNKTTVPQSKHVSFAKPLTSPRAAVRSIITNYQHTLNQTKPAAPVRTSSRVRVERQFGEDITDGTLLEELKRKAEAKQNQPPKRAIAKRTSKKK